jgi:ribonuclease P protein component
MPDKFHRISLDRRHSLAGRDNIDWFFAHRKWIRSAKLELVECSYAVRPLPDREAAVRFLLFAPKRNYKRAHDRNKIKRWLRAAITGADDFGEIQKKMDSEGKQLLVTIKISKPIPDLKWNGIVEDIVKIADHLKKRLG